jgi:hypothetical protein
MTTDNNTSPAAHAAPEKDRSRPHNARPKYRDVEETKHA